MGGFSVIIKKSFQPGIGKLRLFAGSGPFAAFLCCEQRNQKNNAGAQKNDAAGECQHIAVFQARGGKKDCTEYKKKPSRDLEADVLFFLSAAVPVHLRPVFLKIACKYAICQCKINILQHSLVVSTRERRKAAFDDPVLTGLFAVWK
ncbi:MAG: hypothetical protein ACLFQ9_09765 [Desulfobacterales bacterium]